ncbi:hypothetical protein B0T26DRAFT_183000 [Lasiosphaeria miniovina]|uniref:Uncharacterized protein n=1 Tax=Lasiosphaeria miniovina TaxID=1954250 RepID=A0AA40B6Q5_9PEZI|nr:uncharacterized protein B0T26DRAFT_183000 [Lasiosphaeria miniovina]KAK0728701.1 hypothetical protein B0T26DRAFT_183000 [Lasiosphaeria miniovina]
MVEPAGWDWPRLKLIQRPQRQLRELELACVGFVEITTSVFAPAAQRKKGEKGQTPISAGLDLADAAKGRFLPHRNYFGPVKLLLPNRRFVKYRIAAARFNTQGRRVRITHFGEASFFFISQAYVDSYLSTAPVQNPALPAFPARSISAINSFLPFTPRGTCLPCSGHSSRTSPIGASVVHRQTLINWRTCGVSSFSFRQKRQPDSRGPSRADSSSKTRFSFDAL